MRSEDEDILIGGQAVLEGVMMRSPRHCTVAVRRPDGRIEVKKEQVTRLTDRHRLLRLPVIRGIMTLFQTLALGIRALNYSAAIALEEGAAEKQPARWKEKLATAGALVLGLAAGIVLFVAVPLLLTNLFFHIFEPGFRFSAVLEAPKNRTFSYNLIDGLLRMGIFVLYIVAISLFAEIRRVFQYHGAEHKSIHAFESGETLTLENARRHSPMHPRCGTSFLLVVMVVSILVFSFLRSDLSFWVKFAGRLVLVPVVAGVSYEILKFSARKRDARFMRYLVLPGLWLQKITTREPSDEQLEVGLTALEAAIQAEAGGTHV